MAQNAVSVHRPRAKRALWYYAHCQCEPSTGLNVRPSRAPTRAKSLTLATAGGWASGVFNGSRNNSHAAYRETFNACLNPHLFENLQCGGQRLQPEHAVDPGCKPVRVDDCW